MFKLPPLGPRTPREEVIEVMAAGTHWENLPSRQKGSIPSYCDRSQREVGRVEGRPFDFFWCLTSTFENFTAPDLT